MTNHEKYKKAFSALHASGNITLEVEIMEKRKTAYRMKKAMAACAAVVVVFGSMTAAYAADLGGIQSKITIWFHGEQKEMDVTSDGNGSYTYTFTDENGETQEMGAGGVAIDASGNEIPLSANEVLSEAGNGVEADADGKIWLYYYDKKVEVTDLFGENGICKVALDHDGKTVYFIIQGGDAEAGSYGYKCGTDVPADADTYQFLDEN